MTETLNDLLKNPPAPIPTDVGAAGVAVFAALIEDWEGLSPFAQGQLLLAVAILAQHQGAELRAGMTTAEIISKLRGGPR
ncbi:MULTISPECIES: hypothetical protein [unclassified Pseudomonas]|uniref:hypothetical protein n=1 Tax=unclassified Pseudomonas TaxID=196821 RepID=UPI00244AB1CE|nr:MULTISPECIES: hypothetical protein [unclassified Pseudomonas]MDG9925469.1 hypothetical protein [Pseudomonas sp. GD04045]MDH0034090.1 hypothetical protein [Pseudomonas sp. GD04019]